MASEVEAVAFESAKNNFLLKYPQGANYDFTGFPTIDHVYFAAQQIQAQQSTENATRNLAKIQPFLECLRHYGEVVETFVQVKPDVLALIWGPIKCVLLIASTYSRSFDKLLDLMSQIGSILPAFQKYAQTFTKSQQIQRVLSLFYHDILDVYDTMLGFFKHKRWSVLFESLWPKSHGRLQRIMENISLHKMMMDTSITLEQVLMAHASRERALQEYEAQHEAQERQAFEDATTALEAVVYYQTLARIKSRILYGDWLRDRAQYQVWRDPVNKAGRVLWLQGIPGAGKTFLSSHVIRQIAAEDHPLAYAFLDYQSRQSASAIRVLHSFVVHLLQDSRHKHLRHILVSAYEQKFHELLTDVEFVKNLLAEIIGCLSTTFMVIDGLDETTREQRTDLVLHMLELLDKSENLKLLFSSRPEWDISRSLEKFHKSSIRVQDWNSADIKAYVEYRARLWISDDDLSLETGHQILQMMEKVAFQAKGMFLYARLICDQASNQGDIQSLERLIEDLPDGIDKAYDRIFSRIEQLGERDKTQVRYILAMIASSMAPLSEAEIQLACFVGRGGDPGSPSFGPGALFLNILKLCGPLIEQVDGVFHFVHFTAREYALGSRNNPGNGYLTEGEAHAITASLVLSYLCSSGFASHLSDEQLQQQVLRGTFVFQNYALSHWPHHLKSSSTATEYNLGDKIHEIVNERQNEDFVGAQPTTKDIECFRLLADGHVLHYLADALHYHRKRKREIDISGGDESWIDYDPFTFSGTELRVRIALESMLCGTKCQRHECTCRTLRKAYGDCIYKCGRPGCPFFRLGFETRARRDRHMQSHSRPFKCDRVGCPYATIGFSSQLLLTTHFAQYHGQKMAKRDLRPRRTTRKRELKVILTDAVKEDDIATLEEVGRAARTSTPHLLLTAIEEQSSELMVDFLIKHLPPFYTRLPWGDRSRLRRIERLHPIFSAAVDQKDVRIFQKLDTCLLLVSREGEKTRNAILGRVAQSRSPELVQLVWRSVSLLDAKDFLTRLLPAHPDLRQELMVVECLKRIRVSSFSREIVNLTLRCLGARCCSTMIAEILLEHPYADVDGDVGPAHKDTSGTSTPLLAASLHVTQEAAHFMKLLVMRGANLYSKDSFISKADSKIVLSERPGPKNIQKWFEGTWEEMVKQWAPERPQSGERSHSGNPNVHYLASGAQISPPPLSQPPFPIQTSTFQQPSLRSK